MSEWERILEALGRLEEGQAQLRDGQAQLRDGHAQLRAELTQVRVDMMARMDRLQDTITAIRGDILVDRSEFDRTNGRVDSQQAEIRALAEQVGLMFKKMLHIDTRIEALENRPH